jgi:hypothetical protein
VRTYLIAVCAALSLLNTLPVHAGPISDLAKDAESELEKSDGLAAYEKMRLALEKTQEEIPFNIRKAFFVSEKPVMFGAYKRVKDNTFPVGASLITYVEPVGLAWRPDEDGAVKAQFTVDFELKNPAGEMLAVQKTFGSFSITSQEPLFEIYTPLTLDVSQAPAGDYVLKYVFNDANSKKTTEIEQKFTLK